MLNRIIVIGRLTKDPEMRSTSNGTSVTNMRLAVERPYSKKNADGNKEVDYINVVTWRGLAENCAQHLSKGRLVAVDGALHIRNSESNGRKYINPEINADNVRFLDWGDKDGQNQGQGNYQQNNQQNFQNQNYQQHNNQQQNFQNQNYQQNNNQQQNQFNSADINVPF
jgi:single-strand DNA-binding protein